MIFELVTYFRRSALERRFSIDGLFIGEDGGQRKKNPPDLKIIELVF